jgi:cytochrome c oxidase subunit 3
MSTSNTHTAEQYHHAHHFESADHEYSTAKQGVWLFLATEILMFGGLFVGYAIFHHIFPELFKFGSKFTDWRMGAANTVVLLTSSLTMALGIYYTQMNQTKKAFNMLAITVLCGAIFMVVKYFEYTHKIHLGLKPGAWFSANLSDLAMQMNVPLEEVPKNLAMYFSFYYVMTGIHGVHVLIGMGLIIWVMIRMKRGEFGAHHFTAVEGVGLFWHLVDLVWIYLFPLLYLVS